MGFFDLFRPKWQNSDPEVRVQAVRDLGDHQSDVLAKVARSDKDARVRRAAIKRISDAHVLVSLANDESDDDLKKTAEEMAAKILLEAARKGGDEGLRALDHIKDVDALVEVAASAKTAGARAAALALLSTDEARASVVRHAEDATTRDAALDAIQDPALVRKLAVNETDKDAATAALTRLTDATDLEAVWRGARNKAVRKAARARLDALPSLERAPQKKEASPEAMREARRVQLVRAVEKLIVRDDWDAVDKELDEARAGWAELGGAADDDATFETRFRRAEARVLENKSAWQAAQVEALRRAEEERGADEKKAAEKARLAEERAREAEAEKVAAAARAAGQTEAEAATAKQREEERQQAAEARRERDRAKADADGARQAEAAARIAEIAARLEGLAATDDKKLADKELKEAQSVVQQLGPLPREEGPALRARYDAARTRLVGRVRELDEAREWAQWANVAKLEAIIARVEKLRSETIAIEIAMAASTAPVAVAVEASAVNAAPEANAPSTSAPDAITAEVSAPIAAAPAPAAATGPVLDLKKLAAEIKQAQADWKAIGGSGGPRGDRSQALWTKFKGICDELYARCQMHFASLDAERSENLKNKQRLVAEVEALVAGPPSKDVSDKIKMLQGEWKTIGHVPKAEADALWTRFRAACDQFFDRRKEHFEQLDEERVANIKRKEELCALAESAAEAKDPKEAMRIIKNVQRDWKLVGRVPKAESDALWQRFKTACDKAFEAARAAQDPASVEKKEDLGTKTDAVEVQVGWRPATLADLVKATPGATLTPISVRAVAPKKP